VPRTRVLHIVSHTHWDREWYLSFEAFRTRMVLMIDNLMAMLEADADYRCFYLDGQGILLEEYLAVRPSQRERLTALIRAGRIQIGPWYTATDETLVSGESIVRNLLLGEQTCAPFGQVTKVGYLPDQFGHISQIPQLLNGFGISLAVIGRGVNRYQHQNEFRWRGRAGSEVFTAFLNHWYNNAQHIPADPAGAAEALQLIADKAAAYTSGSHLLLMSGVDHLEADPALGQALKGAHSLIPDELVHDQMQTAVEAIRADAGALEVITGELREDDMGRLDAGTLSARMPLKVENFRASYALERLAEPLATLAMSMGGPNLSDLIQHGWRTLLQNHSHDSICGCAIDTVARQMSARTQSAQDTADAVAALSVQALAPALGYDKSAGHVLLYNPAPYPVERVAHVTVDLPLAEPTRAPLSHRLDVVRTQPPVVAIVTGPHGEAVPAQTLSVQETQRLVVAPRLLPRTQPVHRLELAVKVKLPAFGLSRHAISLAPGKGRPVPGIATSARRLENEHLVVEVGPEQALWVQHKATGRRLGPLHVIEDGGDIGDTYHHIKPQHDQVLTRSCAADVAVVENGPLSGALKLIYRLCLPTGASADRLARGPATTELTVAVTVRLRAGDPFVTCDADVVNGACDHRLRILFPSGVDTETLVSGSQFDVVSRPVDLPDAWTKPAMTRPQWGWSDVADGDFGMAVFGWGLPEVEPVRADGQVAIAMTLLRSVGAVSRASATPLVLDAPEAQVAGGHSFRYALYPHAGDWEAANVPRIWETYAAEVVAFQPRPAHEATGENAPAGDQPVLAPLAADHERFVVTAFKPPMATSAPFAVVVRGYLAATQPETVTLQLGLPVVRAFLLNLAEGIKTEITHTDGRVQFAAEPGEIITVGFTLAARELTR
jgi:alpha-mannosidase